MASTVKQIKCNKIHKLFLLHKLLTIEKNENRFFLFFFLCVMIFVDHVVYPSKKKTKNDSELSLF